MSNWWIFENQCGLNNIRKMRFKMLAAKKSQCCQDKMATSIKTFSQLIEWMAWWHMELWQVIKRIIRKAWFGPIGAGTRFYWDRHIVLLLEYGNLWATFFFWWKNLTKCLKCSKFVSWTWQVVTGQFHHFGVHNIGG